MKFSTLFNFPYVLKARGSAGFLLGIMNIVYKNLTKCEICLGLFEGFVRRQEVGYCLRQREGRWVEEYHPFVDDWSAADYVKLVRSLTSLLEEGGAVVGAFAEGRLKGFAAISGSLWGEYDDLLELHVSADCRRMGIGRELFCRAVGFARGLGALKLYISAHSAVESQAFYRALGCVHAVRINARHAESEPFDVQLEYIL